MKIGDKVWFYDEHQKMDLYGVIVHQMTVEWSQSQPVQIYEVDVDGAIYYVDEQDLHNRLDDLAAYKRSMEFVR